VLYLGRWGDFSRFLKTAGLGYLSYFVLSAGVHENHLLPTIPLFALLAVEDSKFLKQAVIISLFANLNILIFYGISGQSNITTTLPFLDLFVAILLVAWYGMEVMNFRKSNSLHGLAVNSTA
jgi:hypothetical protein